MSDHRDTDRAPDLDTDPHGDEVADGLLEVELADLDLTGLVRWLCVRQHQERRELSRRLDRLESHLSAVANEEHRHGTAVEELRRDFESLPCRGGGNGRVPDSCPESDRAAE